MPLPAALSGTALRILATSDLGATTVPLRTSYGRGGTCAAIVELLERERDRQPTIWLDLGDFVVGSPAYPLLGDRPWEEIADLPIAAATIGNHEFDDGVEALRAALPRLCFPVVCANVDVGQPAAITIESEAGPIGVLGLTHPASDHLSRAPHVADDPERITAVARALKGDGARWVVALLHDGVEWWPSDGAQAIATRSDRLAATVAPWADEFDLILGGHNFGAWEGTLAGTPAVEPHLFAASVAVVDLAPEPVVRGVFVVPPIAPTRTTPATEAVTAASVQAVAELADGWLTRTGADRYLPDLMADSLRRATGADAGLVLPAFHAIQAPLDGALGALGPGIVTELDLVRLMGAPGYDPVVAELQPGELAQAVARHSKTADPRNAAADALWWNWCRMPAGTSVGRRPPRTIATIPAVVGHLSEWLEREVDAHPAGMSGRDALRAALT